MIERREDASGQMRRAAALDQLDQRVQIHGTFTGKCFCLLRLESGMQKLTFPPPGDITDRSIAIFAGVRCYTVGFRPHAPLATDARRFLPHGCGSGFDWDVDQVAPLGPGAVVVAHVLDTEQLGEHKPGVSRALPDPAVGDHGIVLPDDAL